MMIQPKALKTSKWAWAAILSICAGFITNPAPALSADGGGQQKLIYQVYAGGIHAVEAEWTIDTSAPGTYNTSMFAKTRGFLGKMAPWSGTFASNGWQMDDGEFRPKLHKSTATWKGEDEVKEYQYTKDQRFNGLFITDHGKPRVKKTVADELTQGTTDVISASMNVFQNVAQGGKCAGSSEVFDGKRRFNMKFNHVMNGTMNASKYNVYEGPAVECTIEVEPIAGKWHDNPRGWMSIQEQGRDKGKMPTMWVAKIADDLPAVPVKIRVKTDYGTLFMHLTEYHGNGKTLIAKNAK